MVNAWRDSTGARRFEPQYHRVTTRSIMNLRPFNVKHRLHMNVAYDKEDNEEQEVSKSADENEANGAHPHSRRGGRARRSVPRAGAG